MSLPKTTRKHIEAQNFEAVEDEWLNRLGEDSTNLDFFTTTARALAASDGARVARQLVELLDEQLTSEERWEDRLRLLESTGEISFDPNQLNREIRATLAKVYSDSDVVETLIEKLGLRKAVEDVPRMWQKVRRLRGVLSYDVGAIVRMEGKGVGRVVQVNVELEKLKVDFETHPGLSIGFGAAAKVLEPLDEDHFLRRKVENPGELEKLAESSPSELLRLILMSQPKQTAAQIKASVAGLIADKAWASWWSRARNHPQLVSSGKGARQNYSWAETAAAAGEEMRAQFARAELKQQLEIFLREARRNPESAREVAEILLAEAEAKKDVHPGDAIRILAALDRSGVSTEAPAFSVDEILRDAAEATVVIRSIEDRALRLACLERIPELRDDWPRIYANVLNTEPDAPILGILFERLWDADRQQAEELVDRILSQPAKRPVAFLWLMQNLEGKPYFGDRNPARALGQLLRAKGLTEFSKYRTPLKKILDDGAVTHALILRLEPEHAESVMELFERTALEEYLRDRLLTALHMRFPDLSTAVSDSLYATVEVIDEKRAELKNLLEIEIPANRRAIEEARELGDLRENFEYKSARSRHEYLSARVGNLERDLARAQPIAFDRIDGSQVRIGATVVLSSADGDGSTREISVLGPWESNPDLGILSYESDAGQNLLGKSSGDQIELGRDRWRIESIEPWKSPA
ncbi:MAG: GreA/GreB family elongation factor [Thermoanaerobaculia bacterium]